MNVLVAMEMSGIIRSAFERRGHNAWSCDLLDTEIPGQHHKGDIWEFLKNPPCKFDLGIFHPPCDYVSNSGVQWMWHPSDSNKPENKRRPHPKYPNRHLDQVRGIDFFAKCMETDIPKVCIENPIPQAILIRCVGKYSQIIQPSDFGDPYRKATCLWLRGLPKLVPTHKIPREQCKTQCHYESPGPMRKINRARTYPGIAKSMSEQWG
jgi:hypothetical protein